MRNWAALNSKRKGYILKFFVYQRFFRAVQILLSNQFINISNSKIVWSLFLLDYLRRFSPIRLKDRCFITGNSKSYVRLTGLTRQITKNYIYNDLLPNIVVTTW